MNRHVFQEQSEGGRGPPDKDRDRARFLQISALRWFRDTGNSATADTIHLIYLVAIHEREAKGSGRKNKQHSSTFITPMTVEQIALRTNHDLYC